MAKKRTTAKKRTLNEFKAWLQGVEELQPAGWAPTADQWKLIRRSIENITEEAMTAHTPAFARGAAPAHPVPHVPGMPTHMAPPGSGTAPVPPGIPPAPTVDSSGVPMDAPIEMSDEAKRLLGGSAASVPGAPKKTKTPDIDTADGTYASTFG